MSSKIKVGHDSEVFAVNKAGKLIPMIGRIGGTKDHPLPVPGGTLQEDNVSGEIAVNCTADEDEFVENTSRVLKELNNVFSSCGCSMLIKPSVAFEKEILEAFAPTSMESGCDPDYNVYSNKENHYPSLKDTLFRHGSGHIHVDSPEAATLPKRSSALVQFMDALIKLPQWLIEENVERNHVQGALGNYRPKKYGIEYRSSSNIILTDERVLRHAFRAAQKASGLVTRSKKIDLDYKSIEYAMAKKQKDLIVSTINYYGGELIL